jgi:hypothetical protein
MTTDDSALAGIAAIEAIMRDDLAGLAVLLGGTEDLVDLAAFLAGGLARELLDHHGPDHAGRLLAGVRALVLSGWQPPPDTDGI